MAPLRDRSALRRAERRSLRSALLRRSAPLRSDPISDGSAPLRSALFPIRAERRESGARAHRSLERSVRALQFTRAVTRKKNPPPPSTIHTSKRLMRSSYANAKMSTTSPPQSLPGCQYLLPFRRFAIASLKCNASPKSPIFVNGYVSAATA